MAKHVKFRCTVRKLLTVVNLFTMPFFISMTMFENVFTLEHQRRGIHRNLTRSLIIVRKTTIVVVSIATIKSKCLCSLFCINCLFPVEGVFSPVLITSNPTAGFAKFKTLDFPCHYLSYRKVMAPCVHWGPKNDLWRSRWGLFA